MREDSQKRSQFGVAKEYCSTKGYLHREWHCERCERALTNPHLFLLSGSPRTCLWRVFGRCRPCTSCLVGSARCPASSPRWPPTELASAALRPRGGCLGGFAAGSIGGCRLHRPRSSRCRLPY